MQSNNMLIFGLFLLVLFLSPPLTPFAGAQQPSESASSDEGGALNSTNVVSPSMAVIVLLLIVAFFITGSVSIYIQQCAETPAPVSGAGEARPMTREIQGLDMSVIEAFPTIVYSAVRELKTGERPLECAICLSEFEDNENLRLLPKCDHVFHPHCIDAWLAGHVTCPVCRANLSAGDQAQLAESTHRVDSDNSPQVSSSGEEVPRSEVRITINNDEGTTTELRIPNRRFPRSHSTGHSLSEPRGEDWERFTLRLPAEARRQVVARARLKRATSLLVAMTRESSSQRGYRSVGAGDGSGSSRNGRLFGRRPFNFLLTPFVLRTESVRSATKVVDDGNGDLPAGSVGSTKRFGGTAVTPLDSLPHAPV